MSDIETFEQLFQNGLEHIYDAEKQLTKALPKMAEASSSPQLRQAFDEHQRQTEEHVRRIERIFSMLETSSSSRSNKVVEEMTDEAQKMIKHTDPSALRDAALIVAGNQVEHFEVACYGSLRNFAELLGRNDIVEILQQTLNEEKQADELLTRIGEQDVNRKAAQMRGEMARR